MVEGARVSLCSRGGIRYGKVERVTETGYIIRLFDGSSTFVMRNHKRYNRGDCVNYGLFYITETAA